MKEAGSQESHRRNGKYEKTTDQGKHEQYEPGQEQELREVEKSGQLIRLLFKKRKELKAEQ